MKLLILELAVDDPGSLFEDERLATFHQLGEMGWRGRLRPKEDDEQALAGWKGALPVDGAFFRLTHSGSPGGSLVEMDAEIGHLLETQQDELLIVLLAFPAAIQAVPPLAQGFYLLAGPYGLAGEAPEAEIEDVLQTAFELCTIPIPEGRPGVTRGRNLLEGLAQAGNGELTAEEEEILRERLNGLGYIG